MEKICKVCGTKLMEGENYCVICDRYIDDEKEPEVIETVEGEETTNNEEESREYVAKKYTLNTSVKLIHVAIAAVICIVICIAVLIVPEKLIVNSSNKPIYDSYTAIIKSEYDTFVKSYIPVSEFPDEKQEKATQTIKSIYDDNTTIVDYEIISNEKQDRKPVRKYLKLMYDIDNINMQYCRKIVVKVTALDENGQNVTKNLSYYVIKYKDVWYLV